MVVCLSTDLAKSELLNNSADQTQAVQSSANTFDLTICLFELQADGQVFVHSELLATNHSHGLCSVESRPVI
jgi:hypothetical protein